MFSVDALSTTSARFFSSVVASFELQTTKAKKKNLINQIRSNTIVVHYASQYNIITQNRQEMNLSVLRDAAL